MSQKFKRSAFIFVLILATVFSSFILDKDYVYAISNNDNTNLVLDFSWDYNGIPKNFRKTSDLSAINGNQNLNLMGLKILNISGSQQFSENNLPILIKSIDTNMPITVVDLRQESHGFINGLPVSWANKKNNANIGLTREQVIMDENTKLSSIELKKPITLYNHSNITISPVKAENEENLVKSNSLAYIRIPVTDREIPSDDMVDYFIEFIINQPHNSWVHFHCKHGIGRTGTFMIMYDITKNYKQVSVDDIINRQLALANYSESANNNFYSTERINFLKNFYNYCKANGDKFNIKWSEWKKAAIKG